MHRGAVRVVCSGGGEPSLPFVGCGLELGVLIRDAVSFGGMVRPSQGPLQGGGRGSRSYSHRLAHEDELFRGAGMQSHSSIEVGFGGAHADGDGCNLDDVGSAFAHHV